jgi:hypothetical protein
MDGFYSHLRDIGAITLCMLLLGSTITGYLTNNPELAKWSQTAFGTILGTYFGSIMGSRSAKTDIEELKAKLAAKPDTQDTDKDTTNMGDK